MLYLLLCNITERLPMSGAVKLATMFSITRSVCCTWRGGRFELQARRGSSDAGEKMPELKDPQQIEKRRKFWEQEKEFEAGVDYSRLNETEKLIHRTHAEAVARGHFTYDDPLSGDRVLTRLRHFLKGRCCGSACRHCIYDHVKVPEIKKKARKFNTAYWTYDEDIEVTSFVEEGLNKVKIKVKERPVVTHKMIITGATSATESN